MVKFVVVHRRDLNNVGDTASNPLQYFLKDDEYKILDAANFGREYYPTDVPLILGGGGLIGNEFIGNVAAKVLKTPDLMQVEDLAQQKWKLVDPNNEEVHRRFKSEYSNLIDYVMRSVGKELGPRYVWGAGHNGDTANEPIYPEELQNFARVGIRDHGTQYDWVPCASCMHPAFNKKYRIKNRVIWFEHKKQLIKDRAFGHDSIPRFINSGSNIEQTIELLGSAEIVLTNSYHGAYWATLLGKRVFVVGPWSTKFMHMKHQPVHITADQNWKELVDQTNVYKDSLDECRQATNNFWESIK
jgi:hypothetical protein